MLSYTVIPTSSTASNRGLIDIHFNDSFVVPKYDSQNYKDLISTMQTYSSVISLKVVPGSSSSRNLTFIWEISNLTSSELIIKLNFSHPLEVSKNLT